MSRKTIITLICLVIGLALIFLIADPFWSSAKVLRREIDQQKAEIADLEGLLIKTEELKEKYQQAGIEAQNVLLGLPKEQDIPYLLFQFDSLASNNGLLLESVDFVKASQEQQRAARQQLNEQPKVSASGLPSMPVKLTLTGSYQAFKGYLTSLENNIRAMTVQSIKFGSGQEKEKSVLADLGVFDFDLELEVYFAK